MTSGSAEEGDDSDVAAVARRELREETRLLAADATVLETLEVTPSMIAHQGTVFLSMGFSAGQPQRDLAEQDMRSGWFTRTEVERMVSDGQIVDAESIAALVLLLLADGT